MLYDSFISVTTPATDRSLLTIEQLRAVADVTDNTVDDALTELGAEVAARISKACRLAVDGVNPPTLLQETITQTFRRHRQGGTSRPWHSTDPRETSLILARSPVTQIISVTADGVVLDPSEYELLAAEGMLTHLSNDCPVGWWASKIQVQMKAGYATVPDDLVGIAKQVAQHIWYADGDLNEKMDWTEGLARTEWFSNPLADTTALPASIIAALDAGGFIDHTN